MRKLNINPDAYDVILADCPWNFKTYGKSDANTPQTNYPTMSLKDIEELPIKQMTAVNCVMFFWVVDWLKPSVCEKIVNAWGFTYRTRAWVWVKAKPSGFGFHVGRGYYTQSNPEDCWLCVKGSMPVSSRSITSLIYSPVQEHSRKPEDQFRKIEALYPKQKYPRRLELFSRRSHAGWDAFGNEVRDSIVLPKVQVREA